MGNRKEKKFKNSIFINDLIALVVSFLSTSKKQSKRLNETEPTRWLQSKDHWKSGWIWHFN